MICHRSSLILRHSHHFETDLNSIAGADGHSKYCLIAKWAAGIGNWQSLLKRFNCWKAVQSLIWSRIYSMHNYMFIRKIWTLNFKLLSLLHHISCFNKICRIYCANTRRQFMKVGIYLKSLVILENSRVGTLQVGFSICMVHTTHEYCSWHRSNKHPFYSMFFTDWHEQHETRWHWCPQDSCKCQHNCMSLHITQHVQLHK